MGGNLRFAAAVASGLFLASVCSPARAEDLYRLAQDEMAGYAGQLTELAAWCDERGLADEAQKTRAWIRPRDPNKLYVPVLPREVGSPDLPAEAPADVVEWTGRLFRLKRDQADALFDLARRAMRAKRASLAFDLALAAIRENPDHEAIRRLLGYQEHLGQWHTLYEIGRLRAGQVWHERFGWIPKSYVDRYEQGQRYCRGRWISAEEDARLHGDIRSGWDIRTEHYIIRTNHSLEAGVELGRKLEELYDVWRQLFVRFYADEAQVAALFAGGRRSRPAARRPHSVVYFRDREDYVRGLRAGFPNIELSIGVYADKMRRAYFHAGDEYERRTLLHEATHQLFHESRPVPPSVGRERNFWIVEGVAVYMETLRRENGYYVLGGFEDDRMVAARERLLNDNFYVPLAELTTYGMERLQGHERRATLYSQASGLTHFLVHYDHGRYRDALVAYLSAVYSGRDTPGTLAQLAGTSYSELDRQYRQFMHDGGKPVAAGE